MEFVFQPIDYDKEHFIADSLPAVPKRSGVYRIFDTRGKLIVLDKTSNLHQRMERFFGERSEMLRDLDLRQISSRIEFRTTDSAFETLYLLYRERRVLFPKTYRKMRTFRLFTLMKINQRQRFPRIYATRQIKAGVDYFGPFVTRGQFTRLKTALERTFKLRPCLYNIRGNDPHPDCLYFQMHTCSRPCNNDVHRREYLQDVHQAIDFIQGRDDEIEIQAVAAMNALASDMNFEAAETVRRRVDKLRRARQEMKETFHSLWTFHCIIVLPADSVSRCKLAFVRSGSIMGFEEYAVKTLAEILPSDVDRFCNKPLEFTSREWQYDEFCLVSNFIVDPLQSVDVILIAGTDDERSECEPDRAKQSTDVVSKVIERIQQRKRKRKQNHVDTVA